MDLALPAVDPSPPVLAAPSIDAPLPTTTADLDRAAGELAGNAHTFAGTPPREKAAVLRAVLPRLRDAAPELAAIACRMKGVDPAAPAAGEEWIFGPDAIIAHARLLAEALEDIAARGRPALPVSAMGKLSSGRLVAALAPRRWAERAALRGVSVEVLFAEGVEPEDAIAAQAASYRQGAPAHDGAAPGGGGVKLILGAGSATAPAPMDALHALFVEGTVALLKTSPLAAALGATLERAFAPIVERGWLRVVHGGDDAGAYLAGHAAVTSVHLTGSAASFDALVWGPPGADREARRAASDPALKKPVTAALGGVGPVMIVPSFYAKDELWYLARSVASAVAANAGCHCFAPRMLVLPSGWAQRALFFDLLFRAFSQIPPRRAFHPGAAARHALLTGGRADAIRVREGDDGTLPWTVVQNLDPRDALEPLFATDPFCPVISAVAVGSEDPVEFLAEAVRFCDARLAGTLAAEIVVHPADEDDPVIEAALERAIVDLRYGAVGINQWPGLLHAMAAPPWGGHPSTTLAAPGSGLGLGHNARMLGRVDKAILRGPLYRAVRPPWFHDKAGALRIGERLAAFHAAPGVRRLAGVIG
jgi:acyl-CoA reductase-like NAD-dependent aldehyde dehydrogenase